MKKVSFRIRQFENEQYLTYNIDNEAALDEDVLDFLEDEEPMGIVPIIYEEGDEFDTFSYDITDKIRMSELSNQEINAEMVLKVLRGLVLTLLNMPEYRIPLSYLVFHRKYIYINSDYQVEFICIPLEEIKDDVDVADFLRIFLATLRYDSSENGDYVAKLLTFINNEEIFNLRNLKTMVEEFMDDMGIEIPDDDSAEIYVDYQEVSEEEESSDGTGILAEEDDVAQTEISEEIKEEARKILEEEEAKAEAVAEEEPIEEEVVEQEVVETPPEPEKTVEEEPVEEENVTQPEETSKPAPQKTKIKTKEEKPQKIIEDELDEILAEQDLEDQKKNPELKIKKNIKVNRASVAKSSHDDASESKEDEENVVSNSILSQTTGMTGVLKESTIPKANPYLIRINTDERIMITKQNFKIGKASMGVDYTVQGNGAVSRVHAVISNKDDVYYIKDNKSTNHTYVNNKILEEGQNELLTHDCTILLGDEEFTFKLR